METSASCAGCSSSGERRAGRRVGLALLLLAVTASLPAASRASQSAAVLRRVRALETADFGVVRPAGLVWSRKADSFLLLPDGDADADSEIVWIGQGERLIGSQILGPALPDASAVVFDNKAHRLLAWDARRRQLLEVQADPVGVPDPGRLTRIPARRFGVRDVQGLATDPVTGRLFLLDGSSGRIAVVEPDERGDLRRARVSHLELGALASAPLRGLAFDPTSGHLSVLRPEDATLFALDASGRVLAVTDLSSLGLRDPGALLFAPSGDRTDAPQTTSLYVLDEATGSPRIVELAATAGSAEAFPQASALVSGLVQTIDTSLFSPPSPDPMGIGYLGGSGELLLSDSEVEEIPELFAGANLFRIDPVAASLVGTGTTLPYSDEPTGIAWDPASGRIFLSDDDADAIFTLDPGPDTLPGTADDGITSFSTRTFNSFDPEGVAYDFVQNRLYIADGLNAEVYEVDPGVNGLFDGVPPAGDDVVASFDTSVFGCLDPEGITYDSDNGFLYVSGRSATAIYHVTPSGGLIRVLDVTSADASNPAGLEFAPSSLDPGVHGLYIADRGVDNDSVSWPPGENDGRIYEVTVPPITPGNLPPEVDAGPDQSLQLPAVATLDGSASDPLVPGGSLLIEWSQVSGPGSVTFTNPFSEDTSASFFAAGTYLLRLTADDGELSFSDDLVISVTGTVGELFAAIPIAAGSDDAEEYESSGNTSLGSSDIEMTFENGGNQTVGLRFQAVPVPRFASVLDAFVQFTVDEPNTGPTELTFQGQDGDDAATFVSVPNEISSRPRTSAQVSWLPAPWPDEDVSTPDQRTPNLAPIVEEIVHRPEWSAGNALALIVTGTGERTAISYDKDPAAAAVLHLTYVPSSNGPPAVSLSSPPEGSGYDEGAGVDFSGSASDAEDGDLTASLIWTSNLDGPIGVGGSFVRSDLSPGAHTVRATVTDSGGLEDFAERSVLVNGAPLVTINAPLDASSYFEGDWIDFVGTSGDAEDGDLTEALVWTSSLDGPLGTGGSFSRSDLQFGHHVITAAATDSGDLTGSAQVTLDIDRPLPEPGGLSMLLAGGAFLSLLGRRRSRP